MDIRERMQGGNITPELSQQNVDDCPDNNTQQQKLEPSGESQENKDEDDNKVRCNGPNRIPTDKGWAWVICASCFVITFTMSLYDQVLAVMFVDVVDRFEVSIATAAVVFTVYSFTFSAGSVISTNALAPRLGDRIVIVLACIVSSLCTLTIAFSPNLIFFMAFHVIKGLSVGSMWIPALGVLGHYFARRRSLATSITNSGISVSLVVVPPLVRLLLDSFGFSGTLLIVSGVEMHAIAFGMLLRPPSQYTRNANKSSRNVHTLQENQNAYYCQKEELKHRVDIEGESATLLINTNNSRSPSRNLSCCETVQNKSESCENDPVLNIAFQENDIQIGTRRQETETEQGLLLPNSLNVENINSEATQQKHYGHSPFTKSESNAKESIKLEERKQRSSVCQTVYTICLKYFDLKLLADWLVRLLLVSTVFGALLQYIPAYIPTLATDKGVGKSSAAMLLTVCGGVNLISSLVQGIFIDCKFITASTLIVISQFIVGTMCHLTHFFTSFPTLLLLSVTQGLFGGARMSLMPVLTMDYVGVDNLSKTLGFNAMVATLSLALHHPFLGYLRDKTGSFAVPFHYVGASLYISSALLLMENVGRNLNNKRKNRQNQPAVTSGEISTTD